MSHLFDSGMSVHTPAWHRLTNVLSASPKNFQAVRKAAGVDTWEVAEGPVFGFEMVGIGGEKVFDPRALILDDAAQRKIAAQVGAHIRAGKFLEAITAMGGQLIEDKKRTIRAESAPDSGPSPTLGVPTTEYEIIGIDEIGEICDALIKALGGKKAKVTWEAFVSLEGGKSLVATLLLDKPVTLPGDNSVMLPMLVVSTRNDGAGAARAQTTSIRVICANTRSMSDNQADANGTVFTFRHGANWQDRLEEARQTLMGLQARFDESVEFMTELAGIKVNDQQTKRWLERFLPYPGAGTAAESSIQKRGNIDDHRVQITAILNSPTCSATRGKALSLLFAGDEFLDHYRNVSLDGTPKNPATAAKRSLLLTPEPMKLRQVQIIRDVVGLAA